MDKNKKLIGIYLLPENDCLRPASGPNRHYIEGVRELKKHFLLEELHIYEDKVSNSISNSSTNKLSLTFKGKLLQMGIFGSLRDIKFFIKNHFNFFLYYRKIKKINPDFVYERASYLNYNGYIICKLLRIPHFYEINGLNAEQMSDFYNSYLITPIKNIQRYVYQNCTASFCVGNIGKYLHLKTNNQYPIQNGIEQEFIDYFKDKNNKIEYPLKLVWVGKAMKHHKLDIFVAALNKIRQKDKIEVNFIGTDIENYIDIKTLFGIKVNFLGAILHENLPEYLSMMHVGIIPYTFEYGSNIKLFLYGAANLVVIAPRVENISAIFNDTEVVFFNQLDSNDLAEKLNNIIDNPVLTTSYSKNLYKKIQDNYTWEILYKYTSNIIKNNIHK